MFCLFKIVALQKDVKLTKTKLVELMNNYQNQKDLDAVKIFQLKSLKRDFKKLKLDLKKASHELAEIQKLINTLEEKPPW